MNTSPATQVYALPGANVGATATFGDYNFSPVPTSLNYAYIHHNGGASNRLDLLSTAETTPGFSVPYYAATSYIQIGDNTGLFSSSTLPSLATYDLTQLTGVAFSATVQDIEGYGSSVQGTVTSLKAEAVNPVPEASTTLSLGLMLGIGGIAVVVRRRAVRRGSR